MTTQHTRRTPGSWTPDATRNAQMRALRRYLANHVLPFNKHYLALFDQVGLSPDTLHTTADLTRIPFTTKADLMPTASKPQRPRDFILVPDPALLSRRPSTLLKALLHGRAWVKESFEREYRPIFMTATTGRSAEPVPFVYTQHDLDNLLISGRWIMDVARAQKDFRMVNMFPYSPHLAFWQTHYASLALGVFCIGTGGGKVSGTEGNIRTLRKAQPQVLIGMPTFLYHVLHLAVEEEVENPNLQKIVLGGEKVPAGMRRKLRELAQRIGAPNVEVITTYGFTEAKMAWSECPVAPNATPTGYHVPSELALLEIVDPDSGEPVPDESPGEIVFTPLDARGSVVIRYRTGDIIDGGLTLKPCPACGRSVPRLVGNIFRRSEVRQMALDKIKGTLVDFNELEHVLDDAPGIGAWQIELRKRHDDPLELDEIILHVHAPASHGPTLDQHLSDVFAERLELRPNHILFHSAETLRRLQGVGTQLKELRLVDHRPEAQSSAASPNIALRGDNVTVAQESEVHP